MLGFESYAGGKRVMESLIAKHGKNHKVLVSTEADVTLLEPREKGQN
jgi:ABC-type sugar transport system substrate-binding protein